MDSLKKSYEELLARMDDAESNIPGIADNKEKIALLEEKVAKLNNDVATLKGLAQVQDTALRICQDKIVDLTARSMANNIIITGLEGDSNEEKDCKVKVLTFIRQKLKLELKDEEVEVAHRAGRIVIAKPRPMIVRCAFSLRDRIFNYTHNLKGVTNGSGDFYYVRSQLPEPLLSQKIDREEKLRSIQKANKQLPEEEKDRRIPAFIKNKNFVCQQNPTETAHSSAYCTGNVQLHRRRA